MLALCLMDALWQEVNNVTTRSVIVLGKSGSVWNVTPMSNAEFMTRSR